MAELTKTINPFGEFRYSAVDKNWMCFSNAIFPDSILEISFEVKNVEQDLTEKVDFIKEFLDKIQVILDKIYSFVNKQIPNKTIDVLKSMWFLSAIELKNDNQNWWIVLEPDFENKPTYNHFLRFTILDEQIIWSNFS